jgi:RNA polymerase sigma-70 factor (ECF subfamily)
VDSDERLLSRFVDGEEEAFEALVVRYEAPLRKLAYGLVRDWGLAEDIAQDAFIRAYRKATTYRGGASVRAWLYRIAINRGYDELRRLQRKKEVPLEQAGIPGLAERNQASTQAMAEATELQRQIARALAELRPDYRTPLVLREIEGMTYREIAEHLGWPLGTVQIRIHRGRLELRSLLAALKGSLLEGE